MKVKVSATYDGGEVEVTMGDDMKATIAGSRAHNLELETYLLAVVYQIYERLEANQIKEEAK